MTKLGKYIVDCDAGITVIGADGNRLNYKIASGDYVLYYSNAYGGWDSLLCNGTSRKTDNIEHLNYRRKSANQSQFSKINYQNNVTPTWSLNTGINVNGSKMYHLLESTMVYLHNLETNEIIPVVITVHKDKSFEFITKVPPVAVLIKKAAKIEKASGKPNREKVATLTKAQVKEIAEKKMPDLNAASIEAAMSMVAGTARSMGVVVAD